MRTVGQTSVHWLSNTVPVGVIKQAATNVAARCPTPRIRERFLCAVLPLVRGASARSRETSSNACVTGRPRSSSTRSRGAGGAAKSCWPSSICSVRQSGAGGIRGGTTAEERAAGQRAGGSGCSTCREGKFALGCGVVGGAGSANTGVSWAGFALLMILSLGKFHVIPVCGSDNSAENHRRPYDEPCKTGLGVSRE